MSASILSRPERLALALCAILASAACADDDPAGDDLLATDTLREVLRGPDYEQLEDRLDEYPELTTPLADASGSLTLFAPTDAALAALEIDTFSSETRGELLAYHIAASELPASAIPEGYTTVNTLLTGTGPQGSDVRLVLVNDGGEVSVNGLPVTDVEAAVVDNGVVHGISGVLTPPSVADLLLALDGFSSLASAITSADAAPGTGIAATLDGEGPLTVFAPVDAGLALPDSVDTADEIAAVLTYHVVPGFVVSASITDSTALTTVNGAELIAAPDGSGGVSVTDERGNTFAVGLPDLVATNGVVHGIDGVLLPDDEG